MSLSPAEALALARFRAELEARFPARLAGLVLFGSRARGEGNEESDLDVLVLIEHLAKRERREVLDLAYELEIESGLRLSPVVRDPRVWPVWSPLRAEIERDGVRL